MSGRGKPPPALADDAPSPRDIAGWGGHGGSKSKGYARGECAPSRSGAAERSVISGAGLERDRGVELQRSGPKPESSAWYDWSAGA